MNQETPQYNKESMSPHNIARTNEEVIKKVIQEKFQVFPDDLSVLLNDKEGVYFSKEQSGILCCLVADEKNGFMYLVTGSVDSLGRLTEMKCDILA